jgi:hypothetical protein
MINTLLLIITISTIFSIVAITKPYSTVYAGGGTEKELCKENDGNWKDGRCDFKTDDEDKVDQFSDEVDKIRAFEEERTAEEDALCDDEDAETTNIPLCKSDDLTLGQAFAEKYNKENCEDNNGKWDDGECNFYGEKSYENTGWEVDEDNFYKEVCENEEKESDECKKHRLSIEDGE